MYINMKKQGKRKGYSLISVLCILMIAVLFMLFGFKVYCNNLYHNSSNVIYDSVIYEERLEEIELAEEVLNNISNLSEKMSSNFVIDEWPKYMLDYLKNRDLFIIYIQKDGGTYQKELKYKMTSDYCDCNKEDCFYKVEGKKVLLF